jgi:hypothetical protein
MSFGWSAGDIAQAVVIIVKIVKALDSADGAAGDYREAVAFLRNLKHTLEPLQTFTVFNAYPAYRDEIRRHVEIIKGPIESFLATAAKFDHSLGPNAATGHHRHIPRKLQWRFIDSKAVEKLRGQIDCHMRALETLLHRLTLYVYFQTLFVRPEADPRNVEGTWFGQCITIFAASYEQPSQMSSIHNSSRCYRSNYNICKMG